MSLTGFDDLAIGVGAEIVAKPERLLRVARIGKCASVGRDPDDRGESHRRHPKRRIAGKERCQPTAADHVTRRICPKGVDEWVYVRQDHSKRFMRSTYSRSSISCTNEDRLSQSIPGLRPPTALLTGGSLCFADLGLLLSETTSLKPCSINDVSVRPSAAAFRLARCNSSSGNRTVVRSLIRPQMCDGVRYVNMSTALGQSARQGCDPLQRLCAWPAGEFPSCIPDCGSLGHPG